MAAVEGKEPGLAVLKPRGHGHVVLIHREMNQRAALESQQRFVGGRAVLPVLKLRVFEG